MRLTSLGDLAGSFALQRRTLATKLEIDRLSAEATTGQAADLADHLGAAYGQVAGIDTSLARLAARQTLAKSTAVVAEAMQTALSVVDTVASDYGAALMSAANTAQSTQLNAVLMNGQTQFEAAVAALNTRFSGRSLFAGTQTGSAALSGAETILTALETVTDGLDGAAAVEAAVSAWFDAADGFDTVAYQGGAALEGLELAVGEQADIGVQANEAALKDTLKGLALAALMGRGLLQGDASQQASLGRLAGETLLSAQSGRTELAARLGTAQQAIEAAETRNSTEISALEVARARLTEIDPYEAATQLEAAQAQLEKIYSITARLASLSLLDFLR